MERRVRVRELLWLPWYSLVKMIGFFSRLRAIGRIYAICLVLSNLDLSLSSNLPGSCIAAGYTTCCDSEVDIGGNCAGDSGSCFCDPSCRQFSDCCSDLDEICPPKDVFSPLAIFVPHITFHSATVRWATTHINVSFSHTYIISYSTPSTNLSSNNSMMAIRIQHATIGDVYQVDLSSLLPNTTYVSSIVSSSDIYGEMTFVGPMITTLPHPIVRMVRANWLNSSSAQVWWEQLMLTLPWNVDVLEYLVYVNRDANSELSEGEIVRQWRFEPESSHGLVTELSSHTGYSFSVGAKVRDMDGTVFETSKSPEVHIFIPGERLFQLQGSSSVPCSAWKIAIESQVSTTFRDSITAAIRSKCGCLFPSSHITDISILCQNPQLSTSSHGSSITNVKIPPMTVTSYVTFRAKLFSIEGYSTENLTELLESWVSSGPLLQDVESGLEIKLVPQCMLKLSRRSEPLCSGGADEDRIPFVRSLEMNRTETLCITVPIFAASLAAEFLLLLTIFLIGTIITLLILSRRDKKCPGSELSYLPSSGLPGASSVARHSSAAANVYSTAPSTEKGSEAAAKEDEGERPSNMATTDSSHYHTNTSPPQEGENSLAAADGEHEVTVHQR